MLHINLFAVPSEFGIRYSLILTNTRSSIRDFSSFVSSDTRDEHSLYRTKRIFKDLGICNHWEYFCTFTFSSENVDRYDYLSCKNKLVKFFNNYRRKSPNFRYLVIPEKHKDNAIHFHGLISGVSDFSVPDKIYKRVCDELVLVPNTNNYYRWDSYKLGFFSCSPIRDHLKTVNYCLKYITKDLCTDFFPKGSQLCLHSQGLRKPLEILNSDVMCDVSDIANLINTNYEIYDFCMKYNDLTEDEVLKLIKFESSL